VFCQWLPLHQLDIATLRSIVASFLAAYPDGWALLATNSLQTPVIGLVGRSGAQRFDIATVRSRLSNAALGQPPARFGIADDYALLGSFVAGPRSLARFAQGAALNTDDHPVVAYQAPRITYMPDTPPADRLITLLHEWRIEPDELMAAGTDDSWRTRLSAYWVARQRFIEAGRNVQPSGDVQRMLAQVREPLLEVLRMSPDFQPAADPLLRMAQALSVQDAAAGQALRDEVMKLRGR
jgi:spermidine synthase